MWVKNFKIQKIAMPHRSARNQGIVLVLNTSLHNSRAKTHFCALYVFEFWYLLPSQPQLRAEKYDGFSDDESTHHEAPSSRTLKGWGRCPYQIFWTLLKGMCPASLLVFRTEEPLKNFMYSWGPFFHLQPRGPQLSDRLFLLSFQSSLNCINTSTQGLEKSPFHFFPLYLFTHFNFQWN